MMKSRMSFTQLLLKGFPLLLVVIIGMPACDIVPGLTNEQIAPEVEPTPVEAEPPPEVIQSGSVRIWAVSAEASSSYDDPEWAAEQVTGAPDTSRCGDIQTAWATAASDSIDWLEVEFDQALFVSAVNIYQTFNPNQVVTVELVSALGSVLEIYAGEPFQVDQPCPYVMSIVIDKTNMRYSKVRLTVDQSSLGLGWNQIDAVELVGDADRTE